MVKRNTEHIIQAALVKWIKANYPALRVSCSGNENSHKKIDQGVDIGEPDLWIYKLGADGFTYILRLELKTKNGKLSPNQIAWNEWFDSTYGNCKNHIRDVAYGFEKAREIVRDFNNL
jgi:hypothetical protein